MLIYGLWSSVDNIAENLTTRLNYFLIEHHLGRSAVGILDAATRITESILHTSRSIAHIQYNKIAQTTNPALQTAITLQALKYALAALLLLAALLTLVPGDIYTKYLFTPAFGNLRHIILILSPGIVILGLNTILSHYFIGSGRIKYSAFTSIVGLLTLLIAGTTLVPSRGITGSALATLIAFSAMTTFSGTLFFIKHKANQ
jgi:O-antigen/teichoic acid export membrane protein